MIYHSHLLQLLIFFAFSLTSIFALSEPVKTISRKKTPPPTLFFQAEKNNVKVLPQRFEYLLIDSDRIRLGDILIDTNKLNFKLVLPPNHKNDLRLKFSWPAGLLLEGDVIVYNNYGKALWNTPLDASKVIIESGNSTEFLGLRDQIATYESDDLDISLIDEMKYLPFMKYCIARSTSNTRIQLCSRELYVTVDSYQQVIVKQRESSKTKAEIYINNKLVEGDQGLIFLNDPKENIFFRLLAENGSSLEIETRMKEVDFKDVVSSTNQDSLIVTAEGTEPIKKKDVEFIDSKSWRIQLPASSSIIYLRGEGGIPMRQEFYVKGNVPLESYRPQAVDLPPPRTYGESVHFEVRPAKGTQLSTKEKNSSIENSRTGVLNWELKDLERGKQNKRYLAVKTDKGEFFAAYQVQRGLPFQTSIYGQYDAPAGRLKQKLSLDWWIENFLFIDTPWTRFRLGLQVDQTFGSSMNKNYTSTFYNRYSLAYRFPAGFNFFEPSLGVRVSSLSAIMKINSPATETSETISLSESYSALGYGLFYKNKTDFSWLSWYQLSLDMYNSAKKSTSSSTEAEVYKSSYQIDFDSYYKINLFHYLSYGLQYSSFPFETDVNTGLAKTNVSLKLSYTLCF